MLDLLNLVLPSVRVKDATNPVIRMEEADFSITVVEHVQHRLVVTRSQPQLVRAKDVKSQCTPILPEASSIFAEEPAVPVHVVTLALRSSVSSPVDYCLTTLVEIFSNSSPPSGCTGPLVLRL